MHSLTISEAAEACGGRIAGCADENAPVGRIVIDSREVTKGDMFAAFRGEKTDGHNYIAKALELGASCCLANYVPEGVKGPVILTDDTLAALESISAEYRRRFDIPVIGIAGSVGKTTAKEMIYSVMSQRFSTLKTEGNLNNQMGVPMTLSRLEPSHEAAVIEMGISDFNEMRSLARMVQPTCAVYTVIGHAHLEFLHDLDGVFMAKTEMLELMAEDAPVIYNGDDGTLRRLADRKNSLSYGTGGHCAVRAENIRLGADGGSSCTIVFGGRVLKADIPAYGQHMVYAALAGAAVGFVMGLTDAEIEKGISGYQTVGRRGLVINTGSITIIDDSYNANPDSMRSSIDSLSMLSGRKLCVLGDMLEMGSDSPCLHFDIGRYAREKGVDELLCCGSFAEETARGFGETAHAYPDAASLIAELGKHVRRGDTVLVKASRGVRLERAADALKTMEVKDEN